MADAAPLNDYLRLAKPGVTLLVAVTALAGFWIGAAGPLDLGRLAWTVLGVTLASAGTAAFNMLAERRADAAMRRTKTRPLAAGRMHVPAAAAAGAVTMGAGLILLTAKAGAAAASCTLLTSVLYLFVYTPLKRRSRLCVWAGAVPGALPPVIGWVAARGALGRDAAVLFAVQFFWQIPHVIALAWIHREDYARVGWKLLPAPDPDGRQAGAEVAGWGLAAAFAGLLPGFWSAAGDLYVVWAMGLGFLYFLFTVRFALERGPAAARWVFAASMVYLPAVMVLFALDRRGVF